jgi:sulfatase modifying factor 1
MNRLFVWQLLVCAGVFVLPPPATAATISMVRVGNPGNAPDLVHPSRWSPGSVDYEYNIGKYEVTARQYTEFLNAVAKEDLHGLFSPFMSNPRGETWGWGANIQRAGESPNFSYSVAANWADRPVNYVSFWDAVRFANWLHNGQPTGPPGPETTEGGAYHDLESHELFGRNPGAWFFLPTENEWYKAAYHDKTAGLAGAYSTTRRVLIRGRATFRRIEATAQIMLHPWRRAALLEVPITGQR